MKPKSSLEEITSFSGTSLIHIYHLAFIQKLPVMPKNITEAGKIKRKIETNP